MGRKRTFSVLISLAGLAASVGGSVNGGPLASRGTIASDSPAAPPKAAAPEPKDKSSRRAVRVSMPPVSEDMNESPGEKPDVHVESNGHITLHLAGVPLADALRLLSEPTKRNIVVSSGISGSVTVSLYDVTFEEALQAVLASNNLGYRTDGAYIYIQTPEDLQKFEASQMKIASRVFRLTYLSAQAAKDLIEPMLSPGVGRISATPPADKGLSGGQGSEQDTKGDSFASGDTLIVTDYEERLKQIGDVIADMDQRPRQVLIEATILRATLSEDNALGIDFTTVGGVDFTELNSTSPAAQDITTGDTPPDKFQRSTFTVRSDVNGGVPNGGFTFGIIKDQIGVFLRAIEQITDTEVIANPKVLALNKQTGQVIVGRRDGYLTSTTTETQTIQTVEFLETGTVLTFRPFIGNDDIVRMEIHPKDSTGGLTQANLPFEQTTEVTTNVMVKDGNTILIGGLFREVTTSGRAQVPLLGNIPGVGALFRRTNDNTVREEVIILLTVHIVKDDPYAAAGAEMYQDVERYRVGMRRGLQWFGRERLAQAHYRWAVEHLSRGESDAALWDARLALHNDPRHMQAIKLIECITQKRDWEAEASSVRTFLRDQLAEEHNASTRHFDRPMPPFYVPENIENDTGIEDSQDEWPADPSPEASRRPNEHVDSAGGRS